MTDARSGGQKQSQKLMSDNVLAASMTYTSNSGNVGNAFTS